MTDAKTILDLIESVDPNDTAALAKIDALVWVYLNGIPLCEDADQGDYWLIGTGKGDLMQPPKYTRRRDALKAIRPDNWLFCFECFKIDGEITYRAKAKNTKYYDVRTGFNKTEELAELYVIIQAIAYERGQK